MNEDKGLIVFKQGAIEITQEQKETFVGFLSQQNPSEAELLLHFDFCARKGVHPLERLIYFTKRQGKYTPITSIDYMRMRAESSGVYAGSDDAVFKGVKSINNKEYPQSATVTVWKLVEGQRCPFTATARWQEYAPGDLTENAAFMWRTKPYVMLAKCSEALALRKAFPGQLQGLYTSEEFDRDTTTEKTVVKSHAPNESQKASDVVIEGEATVVPDERGAETVEKKESTDEKTTTEDDGKIVIWDGKSRRDPKAIITANDSAWIKETFKGKSPLDNAAHAINHLKVHFGVAKVADLSYEKATALVYHCRDKGDDPRWYKTEVTTEVHDHETSSGYSDEYLDKIVATWSMEDTRLGTVTKYADLPDEKKAEMMTFLTSNVGEDKSIKPDDIATIAGVLSA